MATFYNQATLSYRGGSVNSNIVTAELVEALTVTKTSLLENYGSGERMTYVIGIVNSSDAPISTLTLTDDLGAYPFGTDTVYPLSYVNGSAKAFINGVPAADPTVTSTEPLILTGITVPANGETVVVYSADVTAYAPPAPDGTIVNTVTINGAGAPVTATETITARSGSSLTITKSIEPQSVVGEGPLTYTFVIQNLGNEEAGADESIVVTDVFDPILNITGVTLDGVTLIEGTDYTYDEATGTFTTTAGRITVPAATYEQDPVTGVYTVVPGSVTLTVTGTI